MSDVSSPRCADPWTARAAAVRDTDSRSTSFPAEVLSPRGDFARDDCGGVPHRHLPLATSVSRELLWFSPDPRSVIEPDGLTSPPPRPHAQARPLPATVDAAFERVIRACAVRPEDEGP
ncbi:MAG: hypothetical protein IPG47_10065 [Thermoflexaceae bacterium]|nr:hypothetical protein [Thermoflexaceae bacterium]